MTFPSVLSLKVNGKTGISERGREVMGLQNTSVKGEKTINTWACLTLAGATEKSTSTSPRFARTPERCCLLSL